MKSVFFAAALLFAFGGPLDARDFRVATRSGVAVRVLHEASWNKACGETGGPEHRVSPAPAHGAVSIRPENKTIETCDARGCECKGRQVNGPALYYTPEAAFKGTEKFEIISTFPNGTILRHTAVVTVR